MGCHSKCPLLCKKPCPFSKKYDSKVYVYSRSSLQTSPESSGDKCLSSVLVIVSGFLTPAGESCVTYKLQGLCSLPAPDQALAGLGEAKYASAASTCSLSLAIQDCFCMLPNLSGWRNTELPRYHRNTIQKKRKTWLGKGLAAGETLTCSCGFNRS